MMNNNWSEGRGEAFSPVVFVVAVQTNKRTNKQQKNELFKYNVISVCVCECEEKLIVPIKHICVLSSKSDR